MSDVLSAWQAALAAEHRAVFGYGVLGPHLAGPQSAQAVGCSDAHEQLRERTVAALSAAGATPVTPLPDYPELYPVTTATQARRLAVRIEDDCASAWRYLYLRAASTGGAQASRARSAAQAALSASAVRAVGWRVLADPAHATEAFPGVPSA